MAHTPTVATAKLAELLYERLYYPPFSPNLAPCNFFLFPNFKRSHAGQKFESNREVIAAVEFYSADLKNEFFRRVRKFGTSLGEVHREEFPRGIYVEK